MKTVTKLLIMIICIQFMVLNHVQSQKILIDYYDETMHVVDVPDYWIHHQSDKEHKIRIEDSAIVSFFYKHISELKQCDSIPQCVNSLVKIIYVYPNGNFDILTFCPQSPYSKDGICKNGRMFHYDFALDKVVLSLINKPCLDAYGEINKSKVKALKELISKIEK